MTIAFTICSVNYLAQARTLGDSLLATNPDIRFFIGLVDRLDGVSFAPGYEPGFEMVEVHTIGIEGFAAMCDRYNITELNTAVKPFFFSYFFRKFPAAQNVMYFDPDIIVFQPLTILLDDLASHDAVVTPHLCTPIGDRKTPNELHHLNTGVYNLGFGAFSRSEKSLAYITWWEDKLRFECLIALCDGLFVDQNWMCFLPLFVENTRIEKHRGHNVAYWNLHERYVSRRADVFYINENDPLIFFHYSGYDPRNPEAVSKYQDRYDFVQRPDLVEVFAVYHDRLVANGNEYYRQFPCQYIKPAKVYKYLRVRKALSAPLRALIAAIDTI